MAHDYWLEPGNFTPSKGDLLVFHLYVGDQFEAELERPLQKSITRRFDLLTPQGTTDLLKQTTDGSLPVLSSRVDFVGQALIAMERDFVHIELSDSVFSEYLKHEDLLHIDTLRQKIGKKQTEIERYARFIKALIQVGEAGEGALYKTILGSMLEVVLLQNPYLLRAGDSIEVQVLFEGNPLGGQPVSAFVRDPSGGVSAFKARTDSTGIARFPLVSEGIWLLRLVHLVPCQKCESVDWESFWASYIFELR